MSSEAERRRGKGLEEEALASYRGDLLDWYDRHRRDLPWRGIDDPYATWVAEIMLQQTQVATVVDYYRRWMERFPDVESVAAADIDDVLELWEGLGYYRRARFLHRSAETIVEDHGGDLPETTEELEDLPGIGPYTAGAIASIAHDRATPVVDGNVSRVLARLFAIPGDPTDRENEKAFWELAGELVDPERPGDLNQAMMELGATVCTAQSPNCLLCPVRDYCAAFEEGNPEGYPDTASRARQTPVDAATCVPIAESGGERWTYVVRREADGLLGGLWEFPTVEVDEDEEAGERLVTYLTGQLEAGTFDEGGEVVGELTHLFSHIRLTLEVRRKAVELEGAEPAGRSGVEEAGAGWIRIDALENLPMSTAMRRVQATVFGADKGDARN